jgi:hypothetical protein
MSTKKRWMLQPLSWRRGGAVALVILVLIAAAALILDSDPGSELRPVIDQLAGSRMPAAELIERVGATSRIVLLADVAGRPGPKRLAAESIRRLAAGSGLDAVLLEVPSSEQRYVNAYLAGASDGTALLARPAAVHEGRGTPREYLRIYEAVREVNAGLDPSRRIRIVAADVEEWPPPDGAAPAEVARRYEGRAERMLMRLDEEIFSTMPDARVFVFVDGYQTLQGTSGVLRFAGGESVEVSWLGELLRRRSGADARTILVDTGASVGGMQRIPAYQGTELHRSLRRELSGEVAAPVRGALAEVQDAVVELSTPGLDMDILPVGYRLGTAASGYVFAPGGG